MLPHGRHTLGPDTGTLQVRTSREGAYAKAGHDLVMDVTRWEATLEVSPETVTLELNVDPRSLNVRWGFNGANSLTDDNRTDISKTIDNKVLHGAPIGFRSTNVTAVGEMLRVTGQLTIGQASRTITFELRPTPDGSRVDASAKIIQSDFGIKPYSAMLGTLRVRDSVEIVARSTFPPSWARPAASTFVAPQTIVMPVPEPKVPEPVIEHALVASVSEREDEHANGAGAPEPDTPDSQASEAPPPEPAQTFVEPAANGRPRWRIKL